MGKTVMIFSGETSGDFYGGVLAKELKSRMPDINIYGVGSVNMTKAGVNMLFDSSNWGSIGPFEAIKKAPLIFFKYFKIKKAFREIKPDVIVLIDYPGFNMQLVRVARKMNIPTVFFIPPAKWSKDPERIKEAASKITHVVATFKSTYDTYKKAGASVSFSGHPIVDILGEKIDRNEALKRLGLDQKKKYIGIMPGSRYKELECMLPVLIDFADKYYAQNKNFEFILPLVSSSLDPVKKEMIMKKVQVRKYINVVMNNTNVAFNAMDMAVISCGTATLEACYYNVPMVIIYKVSAMTAFFARRLRKLPDFFGLPNLIAGKMFIPEIIQEQLSAENLRIIVDNFIKNPEKINRMKQELKEVSESLGDKGVVGRCADIVIKYID